MPTRKQQPTIHLHAKSLSLPINKFLELEYDFDNMKIKVGVMESADNTLPGRVAASLREKAEAVG